METLEWQVREAYRMQDAHRRASTAGPGSGWYRIVRDPDEAGAVIAGGRLAVILGTELQHLFNCDAIARPAREATIVEGLDRLEAMGVNYVFPIHHKLNQFGGAVAVQPADQRPDRGLLRDRRSDCSAVGLTPLGRFLVEELTARGMLIDTEHMSWKALDDTLAIVEARRYPVLASHVGPFDLEGRRLPDRAGAPDRSAAAHAGGGRHAGRSSTAWASRSTRPARRRRCRVPISCGGADRWANAYLYMRDLAGGGGCSARAAGGRITIGSDWNGFASWPGAALRRRRRASRAPPATASRSPSRRR